MRRQNGDASSVHLSIPFYGSASAGQGAASQRLWRMRPSPIGAAYRYAWDGSQVTSSRQLKMITKPTICRAMKGATPR